MKHSIFYNILLRGWLFCLTLCLPTVAWAQDDVSDEESAAMAKTKANAPVWQETDPVGANYLSSRRALVGKNCKINRVVSTVAVGSWTDGMLNVVDEDLDNTASFPAVIGANVGVSPVVGIRDLDNYYSAGTTVGFCVVANSGTQVLSLDLVKTMHLWLYCDGKRVDDLTVREGNTGSGVKLTLIGVGTGQAAVNLTAVSTKKFDEVVLVSGGGVNADIGGVFQVKYAFVGDPHDIYLTRSGISDYCTANSLPTNYEVACEAYMPSPLVGGIPIPVVSSYRERAIDDDLTNTVPLISALQLLSVANKGWLNVKVTNSDNSVGELFHKGDQVGFKFNLVEVVNLLSIGAWIDITLFDKKGNTVQTSTISAEGLALSLAGGGDQTSYIVADEDFSGAGIHFYTALGVLDLGSGFGVYYGFVRPKPDIEKHHCPLNASYGVSICDNQTSYQLQSNSEYNVRWELEPGYTQPSANVAVTEDGYVTGMNATGEYRFRCYSVDDDCYEVVTLNHEVAQGDPGNIINNVSDNLYELSTSAHGSTGALVSLSDLQNNANVLDGQTNTYATYTGGLGLANNLMVIGVTTKEDAETQTRPLMFDGALVSTEPVRIGFVVKMTSTGLDLDALQFFQIRTYNGETETYRQTIMNSGVVNVGIAGSSKEETVRFTIDVPKIDDNGNPIKFNEFQLWKSGVLGLAISEIDVYYPFMEDATEANDQVAINEGSTILNYIDDNASVSAQTTGSAVSVADVVSNLSNIIDYDPSLETYATIVKGVSSAATDISILMGHVMDFRQQVGVVIDNSSYVNIKAGSTFSISTFLNGEATGESETTWDALGVKTVELNGKSVLLLTPEKPYDEIRIRIVNGLGVAQTLKIYGVILRNDIDHDGISDALDMKSCPDATVDNIKITNTCVNPDPENPTQLPIYLTGLGTTDTDFYVYLPDQYPNKKAGHTTNTGQLSIDFVPTVAGRFTAYLYDASDNLIATAAYTVHPTQSTWKTDPVDADWNNWNNWTNGSPYLCTDVIIPSGARLYPDLDESLLDAENNLIGDKYGCDRIFFEDRAAVEKSFKLNYTKAWVNVTLTPDRYYLLAAPLQEMVTGDMFVPKNQWPDNKVVYPTNGSDAQPESAYYFTELTGDNYWANRFAPRIYQRLWENTEQSKLVSGRYADTEINETRWSRHFNHLNHAYGTQAFSAYVDPDGNAADTFTFRFPKKQTAYYYWNEATQTQSDIQETGITRTDAGYRFSYEIGEKPTAYTYKTTNDRQYFPDLGSKTLRVTASQSTTTFLVPNLYMGHLDVAEFLDANSGVISEVKLFDGNTTTTTAKLGDALVSTAAATGTVQPMEAFFVTALTAGTYLDVTFTPDMFFNPVQEEIAPVRQLVPTLRITAATADGLQATTLLVDADEDPQCETLFDNEARPRLALFTTDEGRALDIRRIESGRAMPLGLYMTGTDEVTLSFSAAAGFDKTQWQLLDRETGTRYDLDVPVTLKGVCSGAGRFVLVAADATGIGSTLNEADDVRLTVRDGSVTVSSAGLVAAAAYTTDGRLVTRVPANGIATLKLADGVNILRITYADGSIGVHKVMATLR